MGVLLTYKITHNTTIPQPDLFDLILNNKQTEKEQYCLPYSEYFTVETDKIKETDFVRMQNETLERWLRQLANQASKFTEKNMADYYTHFTIPKRNGKPRPIDAPEPELKAFQTLVKDVFQTTLQIHPHNAAFAYVPERSPAYALQKHVSNGSKWYMKIDLKNFFPSCSKKFILSQLSKIAPFHKILKDETRKGLLETVIDALMLNGGLPQGSPCSPYLTNIIMLPIDFAIHNFCRQYEKQHFCYTRYADDILISSKYSFNFIKLQEELEQIICDGTPLQINKEKTRYGSTSGANWNLGLMVNKDDKITIGYRKKRLLKQKLLNICLNLDNWSSEELQRFLGEISYFRQIEPDYADYIIETYSKKYCKGKNILRSIRERI